MLSNPASLLLRIRSNANMKKKLGETQVAGKHLFQ